MSTSIVKELITPGDKSTDSLLQFQSFANNRKSLNKVDQSKIMPDTYSGFLSETSTDGRRAGRIR